MLGLVPGKLFLCAVDAAVGVLSEQPQLYCRKGKKLPSPTTRSVCPCNPQLLHGNGDSRAGAPSANVVIEKRGVKPRRMLGPSLPGQLPAFLSLGASKRLLSPRTLPAPLQPRTAAGAGAQPDLPPGDWSLPGHQPEQDTRKGQCRQLCKQGETGVCTESPLIFLLLPFYFIFFLVLRSNLKALKLELHEKYDYYKMPVEVSHAYKTALAGTTQCHLSALHLAAWIGSPNTGI